MSSYDLTHQKVVTLEDVEAAARSGAKELLLRDGVILTPSARESMAARGLASRNGSGSNSGTAPRNPEYEKLFHSPEAEKIKEEICAVGRKLWMRQYVDGNGGNISCRLTAETAICTPTLVSKADLLPQDLCLVDLAGNQLAGGRPRTSEILMHLEIYKNVPAAKAVVHCHPAHATAYAITGRVPPTCIIPEFEVFVGKVALSPYETPGTQKFAETVLPFVKSHNTVLLANHGIVCWADTVTHAEWFVEVVDTYCWTLMLASQLGTPITHIPDGKATDLLSIKQRLGLPDIRFDTEDCNTCDLPERPGAITVAPNACVTGAPQAGGLSQSEVEALIQAVTEAVMAHLKS
jgi:L-fuculose-phosphate aldolase